MPATAQAKRQIPSLLERELLFVTGKGGVGKTTMAAAIALMAARAGRRTIVVEVGQQHRVPSLFGLHSEVAGVELQLRANLASISIDPDRALLEWLQALGGRVSGRVLASSGTFQYFAAAAPGAKELFAMVKISQLTQARQRRRGYELVVIDAPASGHALAMLGSPRTFGAIAKIGPVAGQTREIQRLLEDERRSAYVAVALGNEMAVTETLELQEGLERQLGRRLSAVIVNSLLPRRFSATEIERILAVRDDGARAEGAARNGGDAASAELRAAAVRAAVAVHERARFQHNQVARLRRRDLGVVPVPFVWEERLELSALERISERLEHGLAAAVAD
jgi:anion-transporting  ArsA/GET3 family ATPase